MFLFIIIEKLRLGLYGLDLKPHNVFAITYFYIYLSIKKIFF